MDVKISSCTGFALPSFFVRALIACGDKTRQWGAARGHGRE